MEYEKITETIIGCPYRVYNGKNIIIARSGPGI